MSMQLSVAMIFLSVIYLCNHVSLTNMHWLKYTFNKPVPSSGNPHFQNEAKCTAFLVKMSFICMRMKNHFQIKGWALSLVLIQMTGGTWKRPIFVCSRNWLLKIMHVIVRYKKVLHQLWILHFLRYLFGAFFSIDVNVHPFCIVMICIYFKWIFLIITWVQATYNVYMYNLTLWFSN